MAKIKKCLYIGLGGTGMSAILNTKKMFIETYGEVPPTIGFLGIDTDEAQYTKEVYTKDKEAITLTLNEQLPIYVDDARPFFEVNKDHFSWLPDCNVYALTSMRLGAGQIRTNGRFALTVNHSLVENKLRNIINSILKIEHTISTKYELLSDDLEIHMVFSVCGGTGAGTFINMAYLIKSIVPDCKLTGYGVLPDIFDAMATSGMAKIKPNAYAAIQDLDYLMHMTMNDDKILLDYINRTDETNQVPFNAFFFIDNKNSKNEVYLDINLLTSMISLVLVTAAGELSSASASVSDNLEKTISEGSMDIEDKKAWVAGLGVCEILFDKQHLANLYKIKASSYLIDSLLSPYYPVENEIDEYIDSPSMSIRIGEDCETFANKLFSKNADFLFTNVVIRKEASEEVKHYIERSLISDEDTNARIQEMIDSLVSEIDNKIMQLVKDGQLLHSKFLADLLLQKIISFILFANNRVNEINDLIPKFKSWVDDAVNDYSQYVKKLFKTQKGVNLRDKEIALKVNNYVINKREMVRYSSASLVYNFLYFKLNEYITSLDSFINKLCVIKQSQDSKFETLMNTSEKEPQIYLIFLEDAFSIDIDINDDELHVDDFMKSIETDNILQHFSLLERELILETIDTYILSLNSTKQVEEYTIDNVINKLKEENFEILVNESITKSNPLFKYNSYGHLPMQQPQDSYFIGVNNKDKSRLFKDNYFKYHVSGDIDVQFANIGLTDRIIIYHQFGVVPAFTMESIHLYRGEYESIDLESSHFDNNIFNRMLRDKYTLLPKEKIDDSIELWVKGFIFGYLKNDGFRYFYKDTIEGEPINGYWVVLSELRDVAFEKFKRKKSYFKKFLDDILEEYRDDEKRKELTLLYDKVKNNYFDEYSQLHIPKDLLEKDKFRNVYKLMNKELDYVLNYLQ